MTKKDLNLKDKKLLVELFQNSKQSNRQLSKKINLAKETVAKKQEFFLEENYIRNYSCRIDYSLLGHKEYHLFIRLKNISQAKIDIIIEYLESIDYSIWIGKSFGKYDLKISIITPNSTFENNINTIITNITQKFSTEIDVIDYLLVTNKFKASSQLFLQSLINLPTLPSNIKIDAPVKSVAKPIKVDKVDKAILYELGMNPKQSIIKIAQTLETTTDTVKYRIKKLENSHIISGYSVVFNNNKFNKIWCVILLNFNIENLDKLKICLKKQEYLSTYVETLGVWNFCVTFFASNIEDLYRNLNKIRTKFSSDIRSFDYLIFFEIYKYPKVPKCILE